MSPEAMLRKIVEPIVEELDRMRRAEPEYGAALRQLLEKGLKPAEPAEAQP